MTYIHTCMYTHKDDTSSHHEHLYVNSKVTTNSSSGFLHHLPSALPPKSLQEFSERRFKFKEDLGLYLRPSWLLSRVLLLSTLASIFPPSFSSFKF